MGELASVCVWKYSHPVNPSDKVNVIANIDRVLPKFARLFERGHGKIWRYSSRICNKWDGNFIKLTYTEQDSLS